MDAYCFSIIMKLKTPNSNIVSQRPRSFGMRWNQNGQVWRGIINQARTASLLPLTLTGVSCGSWSTHKNSRCFMRCPGLTQRRLSGGQMLFPLLHFSVFLEMISSQWACYLYPQLLCSDLKQTHQTECAALNVELIPENLLAGAVMCWF